MAPAAMEKICAVALVNIDPAMFRRDVSPTEFKVLPTIALEEIFVLRFGKADGSEGVGVLPLTATSIELLLGGTSLLVSMY